MYHVATEQNGFQASPDLARFGPRHRLAAEVVDADALEQTDVVSGSTFGRIRWKMRNISAVQRPMPRIATSSSTIAASSMCCHRRTCTAPDSKCRARSARYSTLRAESPAARNCPHRLREHGRWIQRGSAAFGERDEPVPDCLRGLDRDLLADDRRASVVNASPGSAGGRRRSA